MRKYDFLFFDLDNTLWDFSTNARAALLQTFEELNYISDLGSFDDYFQVYEEINDSLWVDYRNKKVTKQVLIVERFSRSLSAFNITNKNWIEINSLYLENMGKQTSLFPGTLEALRYLKEKGYRMHIITNGFKEVQYSKIHNTGLSPFIDKVFVSEEIHTTKPHREIFEHALKSSNALKKKSIMIGDSWEIDIEGAQGFGMDQIMILNNGQNKIPESIKSLLLATNSNPLHVKQLSKTFFINQIKDLITIL
ncbi:MAG TPA: YjjG family noncanonical pyrimidine nucleotidase [Prolixibacteraceae bacterium]|nr:YjjG family noncanonical pyrimidine nucleotidase [Prolixibacteraceae bacterium]